MTKYKVVIIDDTPAYIDSIKNIFNVFNKNLELIGTFNSFDNMIFNKLKHLLPDIILLDINFDSAKEQLNTMGLTYLNHIKTAYENVKLKVPKIIMLTDIDRSPGLISKASGQGATGFLSKRSDPTDLISYIEDVAKNNRFNLSKELIPIFFDKPETLPYDLTTREVEVIYELSLGRRPDRDKTMRSDDQEQSIAEVLFIAPHTVNTHIRNIKAKTGITTTAGIVSMALRERIIL